VSEPLRAAPVFSATVYEYKVFYVTASTGSIIELYRQIVEELGINRSSTSRAVMTSIIKNEIRGFVQGKKMNNGPDHR
jgi:hypothetical protein